MRKVVLTIIVIAVGATLWLGGPVFATLPLCNSFEFSKMCGDPYPPECPACVARYCQGSVTWWCGEGPLGDPVYDCKVIDTEELACLPLAYGMRLGVGGMRGRSCDLLGNLTLLPATPRRATIARRVADWPCRWAAAWAGRAEGVISGGGHTPIAQRFNAGCAPPAGLGPKGPLRRRFCLGAGRLPICKHPYTNV